MVLTPSKSPGKSRGRPLQSRAMATSEALQEAFVRIFMEKGYEATTIREVTLVAGTGLGTFYDHFPNKAALAAVCIRSRLKGAIEGLHRVIVDHRGAPLAQVVAAMLDQMVAYFMATPEQWSALLFLERRISDSAAYNSLYDLATEAWAAALEAGNCDAAHIREIAYVAHTISFSLLFQTLLRGRDGGDAETLRRRLGEAVEGYLARTLPEIDWGEP